MIRRFLFVPHFTKRGSLVDPIHREGTLIGLVSLDNRWGSRRGIVERETLTLLSRRRVHGRRLTGFSGPSRNKSRLFRSWIAAALRPRRARAHRFQGNSHKFPSELYLSRTPIVDPIIRTCEQFENFIEQFENRIGIEFWTNFEPKFYIQRIVNRYEQSIRVNTCQCVIIIIFKKIECAFVSSGNRRSNNKRSNRKFSRPPIGDSYTKPYSEKLSREERPKPETRSRYPKKGEEESRLVVSIAVIKDFPAVSEVNELLTRDHARHNRSELEKKERKKKREEKRKKIGGRMENMAAEDSRRGKPVEAC